MSVEQKKEIEDLQKKLKESTDPESEGERVSELQQQVQKLTQVVFDEAICV